MPGLSGLSDKRPIGALVAAPDAAKPLQMEIRMSEIVNSTRTFAAIRAQRTNVVKLLESTVNEVARAGLMQALAMYDAELEDAPAKPVRQPADRKTAAYRAHRTMLLGKLPGTRGKTRTAIKEKIAHYEQLLAA